MCSSRRRPLLVPVLLCALALLAARPTDGMDGDTGPGAGLGPQVARLYEDAAKATRQYEDGRREAEAQRSKALEYERRLDGQRQKIDAMHEDLGRIARAQYRDGGGLPLTARMLLSGPSPGRTWPSTGPSGRTCGPRRGSPTRRPGRGRPGRRWRSATPAWRS